MVEEPKRTLRILPLSECIGILFIALLMLAMYLGIICFNILMSMNDPDWFNPCTLENDNIKALILFTLLTAALFLLLISDAFSSYGKITIHDDRFEFHALFRRPRTIYYSEFKYVGIEYTLIKGCKNYYIYFSHDRLPKKYIHKDIIFFLNRRDVFLPVNEELFEALIHYLPENMSAILKSYCTYEPVAGYESKKRKKRQRRKRQKTDNKNMSFFVGNSYSNVAVGRYNRFYLTKDKALLYTSKVFGDCNVLLGGNWRFEIIIDSETGLCVKFQSYLDEVQVSHRNIELPESKAKKLFFKSSDMLNEGESCHYCPFEDKVYWDDKTKILCIGNPNMQGEAVEFSPQTVAIIENGQLLSIYLDLNNVTDIEFL